MTRPKALRDALVRLRAAVLDLQTAGCYAEAAELVALVRRCEALIDSAAPRAAAQGEAGARTASPIAPATLGLSEAPVASAPEAGVVPPGHMKQSGNGCVTCSRKWSQHHVVPPAPSSIGTIDPLTGRPTWDTER